MRRSLLRFMVHTTGLDKLFTVCWWEQRGCGISYRKDTKKESMTISQIYGVNWRSPDEKDTGLPFCMGNPVSFAELV